MKKILCLILTFVLLFSLVSCKKKGNNYTAYGPYDPYYTIHKEDVPTKKTYSVKGKTFYFFNETGDMMVRDKNGELQVTAGTALASLYADIKVVFIDEKTVAFNDAMRVTLHIPATSGERKKNVLTIKHTNSEGRTTDIRIEIHKDKIIVIHDIHTHNNPGTYATITFRE